MSHHQAACTTAVGRKRIEDAEEGVKHWASRKGYEEPDVVYGDSVLPDTPLLLKKGGNLTFKQIDDLAHDYIGYDTFKPWDTNRSHKQQGSSDYQIFTSNGWCRIKRVIRHKTTKKIYRITTHTSVSDVTEDHSLLDTGGHICKPEEVRVGQALLHGYPEFTKTENKLSDILEFTETIGEKSYPEKLAYLYGFFYGDGSCGYYDCASGPKYSWAINQKDTDMCLILQSLLM